MVTEDKRIGDYRLDYYYYILSKIIDKTGYSEEKVQEDICQSIEETGAKVGVIDCLNRIATSLGIKPARGFQLLERSWKIQKKENLSNFESMEDLKDFIESKVPCLIKDKLINQGREFLQQKKFKKAKETFEKALEIDRNDSLLWKYYCKILIKLEEYDQAELWVDRILEEEDSRWLVGWGLTRKAYLSILKNEELPQILDVLKKLIIHQPYKFPRIIKDSRFKEVVASKEFKEMIAPKKSYNVNEVIKLQLEIVGVAIYVADKPLRMCTHISLVNPYDEEFFYNLQDLPNEYNGLTEEEEFWGLCSCLQAWVENEYNSELLHGTLALVLLDELKNLGDHIAQQVYAKELGKMIKRGDYHTHEYLRREGYLSHLTEEELLTGSLNSPDAEIMLEISDRSSLEYSIIGNFDEDDFRHGYLTKNFYYSMQDGYVTALQIGLNLTKSILPKSLNGLKHLRQLYIHITNTQGVIPVFNKIEHLTNLKIFADGEVIIPDTFDMFPNLGNLNIRGVRDAFVSFEKIPDSICTLKNLQWLRIDGVILKELPSTIGNLKNLSMLFIDNTGLESLPDSIYTLENIESIHIKNNPLQETPKLKQLENKFVSKILEKIKNSDGIDFETLKETVDLPEYKIHRGLTHLDIKNLIYKKDSNYKIFEDE